MEDFDLGQMEVSAAEGLDALFAREPEIVRPVTRVRLASLQQLAPFERQSKETLVHKSDRALWALKQDGNDYFIERLFDDVGQPLRG